MATLKREIKKLPSEQNLRLLSSLVISLANKTSSVEDKCITPWKAGETYQKDVSFVVYNGYIYFCSVTNKDDTFTESHWTKLADNFDELSVEDVKAFLNLTPEQLQTLSSIILDTEVRLDKTYSSSKIYTDIKQCLDDSKAYTLAELGKASGASYKVVSSTGEMTEQKYIYLMSDGSGSYNMYIVEDDGSTTQIGNTTINLSDYYTKTEVDNDFLKKTDATSTYATITTVDGKVDKTDILTTTSTTATDDQVYSAKAINAEVVKKTDIITTTSNTATNEQVYGAFIMNTMLNNKDNIARVVGEEINVDTTTANIKGWCSNLKGTTPNGSTAGWFSNEYVNTTTINQKFISYEKTMYIRSMFGGTWSKWAKVCTTNVADNSPAEITSFVDTDVSGTINYRVKNGICFVKLWDMRSTTTGHNKMLLNDSSLPKPSCYDTGNALFEAGGDGTSTAFAYVKSNGALYIHFYKANGDVYGSFSYPVAES